MEYTSPEQAGVSSRAVQEYLEELEKKHLATHNVILMRGNQIFFEHYWKPFHSDFLHRMYSVSKSFVSIAVGFLEQDGLISLDDRISRYFPEEMQGQTDENMRNQTIRHMLMMSTAKPGRNWFQARTLARVRFYFENDLQESRPPGTIYQYDSTGSFVLGALAERLTGMRLMDYLRLRLFDKIGVSREAYCLVCPGGHAWGDSAVICRPMDLMRVARFVLNMGKWDGEQILNEKYLAEATGKRIHNTALGIENYNTQGYGYQFWRTWQNSFAMVGMGCQFAVCVPDKDMILVYNGDNQGNPHAEAIVIDQFFERIVSPAGDQPLAENLSEQRRLSAYADKLELVTATGEAHSDFEKGINGRTYILEYNPMGITRVKLTFAGPRGCLNYTNAQGDKTIVFGMCRNEYGDFPEEGYADQVGSVRTKGHFYRCAASAAWVEPQKLFMKIQIIDKYFGNLNVTFGFAEDRLGLYMQKNAEDFLEEYEGFASGKAQ